MKKIIVVAAIALGLAGCGNINTNYIYGYALTKWPDGTIKKIEVKRWCYYKYGQVKIIAPDGTLYMLSMDNSVLVLKTSK